MVHGDDSFGLVCNLLCVGPQHTFCPGLCSWDFGIFSLGAFVQIIYDIVVVVSSIVVHVTVLQEFWPEMIAEFIWWTRSGFIFFFIFYLKLVMLLVNLPVQLSNYYLTQCLYNCSGLRQVSSSWGGTSSSGLVSPSAAGAASPPTAAGPAAAGCSFWIKRSQHLLLLIN